ncbi:hypothetical protein TeGR_g3404 [Tetraparma gracilis]|nr:hypothetical protein TeGR_g3404 [Tetraparma gracilis]
MDTVSDVPLPDFDEETEVVDSKARALSTMADLVRKNCTRCTTYERGTALAEGTPEGEISHIMSTLASYRMTRQHTMRAMSRGLQAPLNPERSTSKVRVTDNGAVYTVPPMRVLIQPLAGEADDLSREWRASKVASSLDRSSSVRQRKKAADPAYFTVNEYGDYLLPESLPLPEFVPPTSIKKAKGVSRARGQGQAGVKAKGGQAKGGQVAPLSVVVPGENPNEAGLGDGDGLWVDHNYRIPVEEHQ